MLSAGFRMPTRCSVEGSGIVDPLPSFLGMSARLVPSLHFSPRNREGPAWGRTRETRTPSPSCSSKPVNPIPLGKILVEGRVEFAACVACLGQFNEKVLEARRRDHDEHPALAWVPESSVRMGDSAR